MCVGEDRVGDPDTVTVATLVPAPPLENVLGGLVEVDAAPTAPCFDWHFQGSSCDDLSAAGVGETVGVALPVAPAEPGEFTATYPGESGEVQCRVEPQVGGAGEVAAEL